MHLEPLGIGVTVLCPGFVRTRIAESGRNRPDRYVRRTPPTLLAPPARSPLNLPNSYNPASTRPMLRNKS